MNKRLSFIIPCYYSEHTIADVISEITRVMQIHQKVEYEIITVNDASPDKVLHVLMDIAQNDHRVKVIDLAKNMGKHAALMAGYSYASGDVIISLDDDGQCPLDHLWNLLEPLGKGYDISLAKYPAKRQSIFKNFGSRVNALMTCLLLDKPKQLQLSNFSAMKQFICQEILHYHNPYPYIDGLMLRCTGKIANVQMEERARVSGETGYTLSKSFSLWLNGFTAFSVKPLRIATLVGLIVAIIGFMLSVFIIVRKLIEPGVLAGYSSIMSLILIIGGIVMLMLGMLGEYIGRIYISINNAPQYVIRQTVNLNSKDTES